MLSAEDQKRNFKLWLTSNGYDRVKIQSTIQAIDRADALSTNVDFWTMQDLSDYQSAATSLRKSIRIRFFHKDALDELDQYGAIYAEYLEKRKAPTPSTNNPEAYARTDSMLVTELTPAEDAPQLEMLHTGKVLSPASAEAFLAPEPPFANSDEVESTIDTENETQAELDGYLTESNVECVPHGGVGSGVEASSEPAGVTVMTPSSVKTPTRRKNKTYFQDEMEEFYCWLNENGHMSVQKVKSCISALKTCELFAKENIASDLVLFTSNTNIAVITVNALSSDPVFRGRDSEQNGRYSSALEKYQRYLEQRFNATGLQPFSAPLEDHQESKYDKSSTLCALLESKNVQYLRSDHNYIFVEENAIPPELLRKIKQMNDVISVTSVRRFRKDCLRIRLVGTTDFPTEPETSPEESALEASTDTSAVFPALESVANPSPAEQEDALLHYLDERGLRYTDLRSSGGRLWVLGDSSLRKEMKKLDELGLRFFYARSGSRGIQWHSGWYLYEQDSKLPFIPPVKSESTKPVSSEAPLQVAEEATEQPKLERYKLVTGSATYIGEGPSGAFAVYCDDLALNYQEKFQGLIGKHYFGSGPLVLSSTQHDDYTVGLKQCEAYVSSKLTIHQALNLGQWLCRQCGELDYPLRVVKCLPDEWIARQASNEVQNGTQLAGSAPTTVANEVSKEHTATRLESSATLQEESASKSVAEGEAVPVENVEIQAPEDMPALMVASPKVAAETVDSAISQVEAPIAAMQNDFSSIHNAVIAPVDAEDVELSDELHSLLSDPDLLALRAALIQDNIVTLDQFSQLDLVNYMTGHSIYGREHRQEIQQRLQNRLSGSVDRPEEKRFMLVTDKGHYYGDTQEEAFVAYCDHVAFEHPALFRALLNKKYNNQGRIVFSRERKPDMPLKLNQLNAYISRELGAQHIILYAVWVSKMCNMHETPLRLVDTRAMATSSAAGTRNTEPVASQATMPVKRVVIAEESAETSHQLSPELLDVLKDDDMLILQKSMLRDGILSIEQLQNINLWSYMNRKNLYLSVKKRQDISARIKKRLQEREKPEAPRFKLVSTTINIPGNSAAEALAAYCEYLSMAYTARFKNLINKKYYGQGPVVLQSLIPNGKYLKVENVRAYLDGNLNAQAVLNYAKWLGTECGDPTAAQLTIETSDPNTPQQKPLPPFAKAPAPADSAASKPAAPAPKPAPAVTPNVQVQPAVRSGSADYEKRLMDRINELVLQADLDGIELTALADQLRQNVSYTRQLVERMPQIVQFSEKLIHEESFVDWEEGADQLEEILGKLLDRNDGYVSAAQLYEYARADMQMFLNDNDINGERPVYDMAQHLFGKVGYHEKRLSFQSKTHISRKGVEVSSALDVIRNYAVAQDGVIDEEELAQYLQSLGMKAGNTRLTMRIYNQPIFFIYGGGTLLYFESMGMDEDWFDTVRKALGNLFADLGDHVVLRDIQRWWFMQLPSLPGGKDWTLPLLQNVLYFYSKQLGARTINAMSGQTYETVHAMLVRLNSEIQSFPDAVAAFLVDSGIPERRFEAEQLRQLLVQRGMIAGGELYTNMPKALAKDFRFAWDADGQHVTIKV